MKKILASLLLIFSFIVNAQETEDIILTNIDKDTTVYNKNTTISKERTFNTNLKETYSGKDFEYLENEPVKKEEKKTNEKSNSNLLGFLTFFMSVIFPYLLGGFIVFVILKTVLGVDANFWKRNKSAKKLTEKLIYEDEDIHELNLASLLQNAINNNNFRLAIRYYYLTTLKSLSNKELIDYHKDKTNSEYLFEIENTELRTHFSYLSYVYSYVWYGEFPVDESNFKVAQNKYQSFLKQLV